MINVRFYFPRTPGIAMRLACLAGLLALCSPAHAWSDWTVPTPAELSMTADPAAPGAPAVYLYREETTDDKLHMHSLYVRIKVLTEKGKSYGDVEIPAYGRSFSITDVEARTIHPDGTVLPLTGKPIEKMLLRTGEERYKSTVFSLPSVEPGSILEYRYKLRYDDNKLVSPRWYIQQPIYLHKAHYRFVASESRYITGAHGDHVFGLMWAGKLPHGDTVKTVSQAGGSDAYELDVADVPPIPDESYMPPFGSTTYRLLFYYATTRDANEYWKKEGKFWSKEVDRFANPSSAMHAAVDSLTTPADSQDVKLRKLYAAVMGLENTRFTRQHTAQENKAEGLKVKTADNIWEQKRGSPEELDRLFIALARAAGFKAYDMIVVNRDSDLLMTGYMDWNQLDDEIAIVQLNGADLFLDPGERYAEFGKLHWKHTWASGVRQVDGGTAIVESGNINYKDSQVGRTATLKLDDHGAVSGWVRVVSSGAPALYWRQRALQVDDEELHQEYDKSIRDEYPAGVEVKLDHFIGLTDPAHLLMAVLKVEGTLGVSTGHRVLLPASFFSSNAEQLFTQQTRETPVDLHYPVTHLDSVTLTLPPTLKIESLPKDGELSLPKCAGYTAHYAQKENTYTFSRTFVLGVVLYTPGEYTGLRDFYQKMGVKDEEQAVLTVAAPSAGGAQ
jgi:hypothetical protein